MILTKFVINANKYAFCGDLGPIAIALKQQRNRLRIVVADRGIVLPSNNKGFRTRMLEAMLSRLSGTIQRDNNHPGLRVTVTAPIAHSDWECQGCACD